MKMNRSKVALIPCRSYEDDVYGKICEAVDLLGGIESFVKQEEKILVKPNVLSGAAPEKAITTHPAVFGAVLRLLQEKGFSKIQYGDSSGPQGGSGFERNMEVCGTAGKAEEYHVPAGDFTHYETVKYPSGRRCREFALCKAVNENDAIISLCKMKTHALENITGAVKNQYGLIYGSQKAKGHAKYPDSRSFADMLTDLCMCTKPRLYIMDGIIAMEGNGPASGDPVPMKVLLASSDPVALDTVFASLIYLNPEYVPTCVSGAAGGLGIMNADRIEVLTPEGTVSLKTAQERFGNPKFNVKREKPRFWRLASFLPFKKKKTDRPVVDTEKCVGCGICMEACPVEGKAVHSGNGKKAEYDYKKCIRCYCCQEMCPVKAIRKES